LESRAAAGQQPLTADEARAAAAAEGLELVPSSTNETGFKGVRKHRGKNAAQIHENGKTRCLGTFATPEEAALCYARHIRAERVVAEAAEERVAVSDDAQVEEVVDEAQEQEAGEEVMAAGPQPLTADEAKAAAAAEGLELVLSSLSSTGFKGVRNDHGKYRVEVWENGKHHHLGSFATPEEAALSYARHFGAERAAAAEARVAVPRPLTAETGEEDGDAHDENFVSMAHHKAEMDKLEHKFKAELRKQVRKVESRFKDQLQAIELRIERRIERHLGARSLERELDDHVQDVEQSDAEGDQGESDSSEGDN
jgi:hypothetical protein